MIQDTSIMIFDFGVVLTQLLAGPWLLPLNRRHVWHRLPPVGRPGLTSAVPRQVQASLGREEEEEEEEEDLLTVNKE